MAAAQGQSFSVLGNLMALRDADNSGASTPATNNSSIDLTQTPTEERPRPDLNSAASSPVKEKDVGEANLTEPTATSTSLQTPNSGSEAKPRRNDKSSNSLFSLKGHPAFLDKPGKMFASAAQSALSTPGGVARSVAKNMKTDSGAAKKRRRERKKDMIRAKLAAIVERQQFIMKLTRALMMFGSPSHRLEALITNTGTFLECPLQCVFTPGVMTMSFIDPATRTSETKFIKQGVRLPQINSPVQPKGSPWTPSVCRLVLTCVDCLLPRRSTDTLCTAASPSRKPPISLTSSCSKAPHGTPGRLSFSVCLPVPGSRLSPLAVVLSMPSVPCFSVVCLSPFR